MEKLGSENRKGRSRRRKGRRRNFASLLSVVLAVTLCLQGPLQSASFAGTMDALGAMLGNGGAQEESVLAEASPSDADEKEQEQEKEKSSPSDAEKASPSNADGEIYDEDGFLLDGDILNDIAPEETDKEGSDTASDSDADLSDGELQDGELEVDKASDSDAEELQDGLITEVEITYPAQSFSGSAGTVRVDASAEEGVLPDGTEMIVTAISKREALQAAKEAAEEEKEVRDAVGVDISFRDRDGEEIEPNGGISVSLSLKKSLEGETFSVVHKDDDGSVETVTESADADGADFTADRFSIYIISGADNPARATYVFHGAEEVLSTQTVKNGETLYAPASPEKAGYVFRGWAEEENAETGDLFETKTISGLTESSTIDLYPVFAEIHYVFFLDQGGNIAVTREGTKGDEIDLTAVSIPLASGEAVEGWYYDSALTKEADSPLTIGDSDITLYPKVQYGHWLKFNTDGGTSIAPQFVQAGSNPTKPADPTRNGYTFVRWTDADGNTFDFDSALTAETTIKAVWTDSAVTSYTVIYWQQSREDAWNAADADKTYKFYASEQITGVTTGSTVSADAYSSAHLEEGFTYNRNNSTTSATVYGDGSTVVNVYYDRLVMTVTFKDVVETQVTRYRQVSRRYSGTHTYLRYSSPTEAEEVDCTEWWWHTHNDVAVSYTETVTEDIVVRGLYGAQFDWNGTEPAKRDANGNIYGWYCGEKETTYYFLDTFYFGTDNNDVLTSITLTRQSAPTGNNKTDILIYFQNTDGSTYPTDAAYESVTRRGNSSIWYFTETFDGFTVDSYRLDNSSWNDVSTNGSCNLNNARTLSIRYRRNAYTVTFRNGNQEYAVKTLNYEAPLGSLKTSVTDPTEHDNSISEFKTEFSGWYLDQSCTQPFDFSDTMPSHNIILYAGWTGKTYTVTAHTGDGEKALKVEAGGLVSSTAMPLVENESGESFGDGTDGDYKIVLEDGQRFVCWATKDDTGAYHEFSFDTQINEDVDLYPYIISTSAYKITYDLNGGTGAPPADTGTYAEGARAKVLGAEGITGPADTPYFQYWTYDGNPYYPGDAVTVPANDITLVAHYSAAPQTVTLTYHMSAPGDTAVTYQYQEDGTADLRNNESLTVCDISDSALTGAGFNVPEGYTFSGWTKTSGSKTVDYKAGDTVGVDSLQAADNHLYAVFKQNVTLTASTVTRDYDGGPLENNDIAAEGLPAGYTAEAILNGSQTDVGSCDHTFAEYVIRDAGGNNVTEDFAVTTVDGTLTVNPAPLTVTTGSASKEYDGTPLTYDEYSFSGLVNGETAAIQVTGTQTEVGSSSNTYSITWGTAKKSNYEITENLGTLTVTANTSAVTITAPSSQKVYDGTALTPDSQKVTYTGLPAGFTVTAEVSGSQTDAGASDSSISSYQILKDGVDVTGNFTSVTTVPGTLTVNPAPLTVTTGSAEKEYDGTPLTKADGASPSGLVNGETVSFEVTGTQTEVGGSVNTYTITWDGTAEQSNYAITENLGTLTVTANTTAVTITAPTSQKVYDGTALTPLESAVTSSGLPEGFTVTAEVNGTQTDAGTSPSKISSYQILKDGENVTDYFTEVTLVDGTLTVTKAQLTIKTGSASKEYDGTALTCSEVEITGLVTADQTKVTVTTTGSQTEVGSSENGYDITWGTANKDNYEIAEVTYGTLTVTETDGEVILTAESVTKVYDGTLLTNSTFTWAGLPDGFTVTATVTGSLTNVGTAGNTIDKDTIKISDTSGKDVTANYTNISTVSGTLTVTPRPLTITTDGAEKEYDGTPLTNSSYTTDGLVSGETVTVTVTGSQTKVGSSENSFTEDWGTTNSNNYEITRTPGTLTVTKRTAEVTLTAASAEKIYDGTALTNPEVTAAGLPDGFTISATAEGSITNAGTTPNDVKTGYQILDSNLQDVTDQFSNIETASGVLTVLKKALKITSGSDTKEYDGTPLTKTDGVTTEGLVSDETVTVTVTGSRTDVGSSENTFDVTWGDGTAQEGNYELTTEYGTLTVTNNRTAKITLTAASAEKTYDGTPLTKTDGVTAAGLPDGLTFTASSSGSRTDAGATTNEVTEYTILDGNNKDVTSYFEAITKVSGTLKVNPATLTITTESATKEYDGTALTNSAYSAEGFVTVSGVTESAAITVTGEQIEVGSSDNPFEIRWEDESTTAKEQNYTVVPVLGTLEVTKNSSAEITLTAASDSKTYDGTPLVNPHVDIAENLPEGFTVTASAKGSLTDAGSSRNAVDESSIIIRDAEGNDKTANFTGIKTVDGTLTVSPKPITVVTGTDSKAYDGRPLTNSYAEIIGFVDGEAATAAAKGSQTEVGTSFNTYEISWGTAKEENYAITEKLGQLTVTANDAVVLTAASETKVYDGKPLENSSVTATGLPEGFTAEAAASGSVTNVSEGEVENKVLENYVIRDADGQDRTRFFKVQTVPGTLKVEPLKVTLTAGSASRKYDGTPLTCEEVRGSYVLDGELIELRVLGSPAEVVLARGEIVTLTVTGSQTHRGKSENKCSVTEWGNTIQANYDIEFIPGTLEVTPAVLTIKTGSASKEYDGSALTNPDVEVTGLAEGETVDVVTTGTQTGIGSSENTYRITWGEASTSSNAFAAGARRVMSLLRVLLRVDAAQDQTASSAAREENYTIEENLGTLTVTANTAAVTFTAPSASKTYDGTPLTKTDGVTAEGLPEGFSANAAAEGSQTEAGSSANVVRAYQILDADGTDVTRYFTNIVLVDGTLTVTRRSDGGGSSGGGSGSGGSGGGGSSTIGGHAHVWENETASDTAVPSGPDASVELPPAILPDNMDGREELRALPKTGEGADGRLFRLVIVLCAGVLALLGFGRRRRREE